MATAMDFVELKIKRVCAILNSREPHHTKIKMQKPGKASLRGDDFKVSDKIKVLYA